MPRYKFHGDSPRSLPEYAIERVEPGQTVETVQALDHPDFELVTEEKKAEAPPKKEQAAQPAPASKEEK